MNNEQLHSMEPLWNHWYIEELLGEGSFGSVYRIRREEFGEVHYAALKVIGVPQAEQQVRQCFAEGMEEDAIWKYFEEMVEEVYQEIALMARLKGKSNIVSYEDHEIRKRTEGIGYDILIRMELLTSLEESLYKNDISMTEEEVITLGKDLCQALCVCGKHNIIHRDIKPANIFISRDGDYKLGDFGIARSMQECPKDLSIKGSYTYMAPEVYLGNFYDSKVDIYSLGIVLYTILNHNYIPFLQKQITYENKTKAIKRRLGGEKIPRLSTVSKDLADLIEKAIAYSPEKRISSPEKFLKELELVEKKLKNKNTKKKLEETIYLNSNDEKRKVKNDSRKRRKVDSNRSVILWKKIYIYGMAWMMMCLFGGVIIFAGVREFNQINFSIPKEEKEHKLALSNAYAKDLSCGSEEDKNTETPKNTEIAENTEIPKNTEIAENTEIPKSTEKPKNRILQKENKKKLGIQALLEKKNYQPYEIKELYFSNHSITELDVLAEMENLAIVDLSGNQIESLLPLKGLEHLEICNFTGNPISNLDGLASSKHMSSLWIGSTKVENLAGIEEMTELRDLHIEKTEIKDISQLTECKKLSQIDCSNCKGLKDITALLQLKNLQYVSLEHTSVSKKDMERLYLSMKKNNENAYLIQFDGSEYRG